MPPAPAKAERRRGGERRLSGRSCHGAALWPRFVAEIVAEALAGGGFCSGVLQQSQHLAMHDLVAGADRAGFEEILLAVGAGDEAARLANQQRARRDVPGIEAALPERVEQ